MNRIAHLAPGKYTGGWLPAPNDSPSQPKAGGESAPGVFTGG